MVSSGPPAIACGVAVVCDAPVSDVIVFSVTFWSFLSGVDVIAIEGSGEREPLGNIGESVAMLS
jgi:hypothetical protein